MNHVEEFDDIWMFEFLQEGNFPDGGARDALFLVVETNPFEGNDGPSASVLGLVDDAIRSLSKFFYFL